MEITPKTLQQIQSTIKAARDSVWVIEDSIQKLTAGEEANSYIKDDISRNVAHLKIVVSDTEIIASGENIADLVEAISTGEAKVAETTWLTQYRKNYGI